MSGQRGINPLGRECVWAGGVSLLLRLPREPATPPDGKTGLCPAPERNQMAHHMDTRPRPSGHRFPLLLLSEPLSFHEDPRNTEGGPDTQSPLTWERVKPLGLRKPTPLGKAPPLQPAPSCPFTGPWPIPAGSAGCDAFSRGQPQGPWLCYLSCVCGWCPCPVG